MFDNRNGTYILCNCNIFHHPNVIVTETYEIIVRGYDSFVKEHRSYVANMQ